MTRIEDKGTATPVVPARVPKLEMWPHNQALIQQGAKTTTFRSKPMRDGWYRLSRSNILVYMVQRPKDQPIKWTELSDVQREAYAESEGFKTVAAFLEANRRVRGFRDFINGKPYYRHEILEVRIV